MATDPLIQLSRELDTLLDAQLVEALAMIQGMLDARRQQHATASNEKQDRQQSAELSNGIGQGYYENKMINGCGPYIYIRYRYDGRLCSRYVRKAKADTI